MLVIVAFVAVAVVAAVWFAVSRRTRPNARVTSGDWTGEAGSEFTGLSESARCDVVFAVAALGDERSLRLLERALDDPSEPVALAAAHALTNGGNGENVRRYLAANPGARSSRIAAVLGLLDAR